MYKEIGKIIIDRWQKESDIIDAIRKAGYEVSVIRKGFSENEYHILAKREDAE